MLHLIDGLAGGGAERWVWDIVRLSPENFRHYVVTVYPDRGNFVYADYLRARGAYYYPASRRISKSSRKRIQHIAAQHPDVLARRLSLIRSFGRYGLAAWRVMKALIQFRPDVVHAHGCQGLVAGLLVKAISNNPLIHTVPALFSQLIDAGFDWMPRLYARQHSRVDYFFTGGSRDELLAVGVPASKVVFIYGGVDLHATNAVRAKCGLHYAEVKNILGLSEDARIALSVGRLHSSKGHSFALEALPALLDRFANLHWVVLGEGEERAALEARASELGVADHVHLIGFRPDPLPYYAAADIYLRTMVFEAENLSSYQAMAMGLPVVGFDTGRETELIRKVGHGILVPNRDSAALAEAVAHIMTLPDGGRTMGEFGVKYCQEHLDVQQTVSLFSSVYASLHEREKVIWAKQNEKNQEAHERI